MDIGKRAARAFDLCHDAPETPGLGRVLGCDPRNRWR
jgi:hypothetical protein